MKASEIDARWKEKKNPFSEMVEILIKHIKNIGKK